MGMRRKTYERRFRQLFAEIVNLVDEEIRKWQERLIEVRKDQVSPEKFVYTVEWRGQPLNAFILEFREKDKSGYPSILLYYDNRAEEIYQLPQKTGERMATLILLLRYFIKETITAEAKRVALQLGLFAGVKGDDLIVHIGNYEFRLKYLLDDHSWLVECDDLYIWDERKCGDSHPLEYLSDLLRAFVLRLFL